MGVLNVQELTALKDDGDEVVKVAHGDCRSSAIIPDGSLYTRGGMLYIFDLDSLEARYLGCVSASGGGLRGAVDGTLNHAGGRQGFCAVTKMGGEAVPWVTGTCKFLKETDRVNFSMVDYSNDAAAAVMNDYLEENGAKGTEFFGLADYGALDAIA